MSVNLTCSVFSAHWNRFFVDLHNFIKVCLGSTPKDGSCVRNLLLNLLRSSRPYPLSLKLVIHLPSRMEQPQQQQPPMTPRTKVMKRGLIVARWLEAFGDSFYTYKFCTPCSMGPSSALSCAHSFMTHNSTDQHTLCGVWR